MKKIWLIPTILSVASIPIINLSGCNKQPSEQTTFDLNTIKLFRSEEGAALQLFLSTYDAISLKKDQWYTLNIDISIFSGLAYVDSFWGVTFIDKFVDPNWSAAQSITDANVWVDDIAFKKVDKIADDLSNGEYCITSLGGDINKLAVFGGHKSLTQTSKIVIQLKVESDFEGFYPAFNLVQWYP